MVTIVECDPDDDKVIEPRSTDGAETHRHRRSQMLLSLGAYEGIDIITPRDFIAILRAAANPRCRSAPHRTAGCPARRGSACTIATPYR